MIEKVWERKRQRKAERERNRQKERNGMRKTEKERTFEKERVRAWKWKTVRKNNIDKNRVS